MVKQTKFLATQFLSYFNPDLQPINKYDLNDKKNINSNIVVYLLHESGTPRNINSLQTIRNASKVICDHIAIRLDTGHALVLDRIGNLANFPPNASIASWVQVPALRHWKGKNI